MNPTEIAKIELPMPITTPRLLLRIPQLGEGKKMYEAIKESFNELHLWIPWATKELTIEQCEEFIRQSRTNWVMRTNKPLGLPMFIFDKNTLLFLGLIAPHTVHWDVPCMEIGYWIRTPYSGKGYMSEAVNAVTQYAFKQMKMLRVEIRPNNEKSRKIPERLGYKLEAILKSNRRQLVTNELADTIIYVRHDLEGLQPLDVSW
jgi:RimJ/RimL family protein N-acetyltransferase